MSDQSTQLRNALRRHQSGDLRAAREQYEQILRRDPRHPDALHLCGLTHLQAGAPAQAAGLIRRALDEAPDTALYHVNLGAALKAGGEPSQAAESYRAALRLDPKNSDAYYNLGVVLESLGEESAALDAYREALAVDDTYVAGWNNLGILLRKLGRGDEAVEAYRRAMALSPGRADLVNNLGSAWRELGQPLRARECFDRALRLDPHYADAHRNRALVNIQLGEFAEGWDEYEWRKACTDWPTAIPLADQWNGDPLNDRTVLVRAEQGLGDEIMFASCIPDLVASCRGVVLECDPRLRKLFARSLNVETINRDADAAGHSPVGADCEIDAGSLPRLFRRSVEDFRQHTGFLKADPALVLEWRSRLSELGEGLKVGISWRGGGTSDVKRRKSTCLEDWAPLLRLEGMAFINLQYGSTRKELDEATQTIRVAIHDWDDCDPLNDLDSFAALLTELDLVISTANATVHLAGALGVPVWTLLSFSPDFRWQHGRDTLPWYPSVRGFRQTRPGDWSAPLEEVASRLRALARSC